MDTELFTASFGDINMSLGTAQHNTSDVTHDLKTKLEKQCRKFFNLKQKVIHTHSIVNSYRQTKGLLEEKEKQLQSKREECETISADYKKLLEKFIPLEKSYDKQKETLCSLQAELQNVNAQKLATEMHAKQLQVLVSNLESEIEVAKVEYQLLKSSHKEEKKQLMKESKSEQRVSNKIHSDLLMFGNAARKAGILTKRQISLLVKYNKSEESTCSTVEDDEDIIMSPSHSSNNGILSCRSVDTGRGSSLMSSDDEKITDNVLCDLINDSQIDTPLGSPKTVDTILDAGLLEAKLKSFCTTATSPIQRVLVHASTSPIKKLKKKNAECSSTPSIMQKLLAKHQLRSEVSDTRVDNMLKEMITDYTLVSPIPWKNTKDVKRRLLPRNLSTKVEQQKTKLRYMLDRKKSRLSIQKTINNIERKVNKLLESKNEVRPPNISCPCDSKTDELKPTEKLNSEEIINLVSRVALQTLNQMNNSVVSTILNTLLPMNSIYSNFKAAEADKSQEILNKFMHYITTRERIESPSVASVNSGPKTNCNVSSEKTLSKNKTTQINHLDFLPINDTIKNIPANTLERNVDNCNESNEYVRSIGTLNHNYVIPETLPIREENSKNHNIMVRKSTKSNTSPSNDSQINFPPNLDEASTNCGIVSSKRLPKSKGIKRKIIVEKNEIIVNNNNLTINKKSTRTTDNTTPVESMNNLFGDSNIDCHEEMSNEDHAIPLENSAVKTNSLMKKERKKSKVTKLQSLRKSLRSCNRKIQREPSPPPAKRKKRTVNTVEATKSKDKLSQVPIVSIVKTDFRENIKKAVKIMNEIKNEKLLQPPTSQQLMLRKSPIRKKPEVEQLANEMEPDKNDTVTEIEKNCDDIKKKRNEIETNCELAIQTEASKLKICSSTNISCKNNLNGDETPNIDRRNSISKEENEVEQRLIGKSQDTEIVDGSSKHMVNYNDLDMFTESTNNESSVQGPMQVSKRKDNSSNPVSGKSFFIGMIEKYSSSQKRKTKPSKTGKVPTDITTAIQKCINNILDSALNEPIREMNKLCDKMIHVKPTNFAQAVVETLLGQKQSNDCLCCTYTPPAPPMYKSEQILFYIINKFQNINNHAAIITTIMDNIEYKLFRLGSTPELDQVKSLSRFFAVLCRHTKQMRRLRTFVLDALYCLSFKFILVFHEVINVWSHIIPKACTKEANDPLVLTIVHLIHFLNYHKEDKTEHLRKLLAVRYGYNPGNCNQHMLLVKLDSLVKEIGVNDTYNHKSLRLAFILVGKRYGPQWCDQYLVNGIIIPILNDTVLEQHIRAFAASLLGPLVRPFPSTMSLHREMAINKLMPLIEIGDSWEIEEAAISSVLMLKKFAYTRVVNTLQNWEPKRPISEELENQVKEFVREKQTKVWIKMLENA